MYVNIIIEECSTKQRFPQTLYFGFVLCSPFFKLATINLLNSIFCIINAIHGVCITIGVCAVQLNNNRTGSIPIWCLKLVTTLPISMGLQERRVGLPIRLNSVAQIVYEKMLFCYKKNICIMYT